MRDRIRRSRLRLLQLTTEGAREPFTPPMLSASPRALRWIDADGAFHERALDEAYEAIWYGTVPRLRGRLDDEGHDLHIAQHQVPVGLVEQARGVPDKLLDLVR